MTTPAHIYERVGGLTFPLPDSESTSLADLDPAREGLIALFRAAMNAELGARWAKATAGLPAAHPLYGSTPVRDAMGLEASLAHMQQRQAGFPLLVVHRFGKGGHEQHTLYDTRVRQLWQVSYILGPLEIADVRRFGDACTFFWKLIGRVSENRGHPAHENGELQFQGPDGDVAELGALRVIDHEGPGQAAFAGDDKGTGYYAVTVTIETLEHASVNAEGESCPLQGADYDLGIGGAPEGVIRGLVYASTDPPFQAG